MIMSVGTVAGWTGFDVQRNLILERKEDGLRRISYAGADQSLLDKSFLIMASILR